MSNNKKMEMKKSHLQMIRTSSLVQNLSIHCKKQKNQLSRINNVVAVTTTLQLVLNNKTNARMQSLTN